MPATTLTNTITKDPKEDSKDTEELNNILKEATGTTDENLSLLSTKEKEQLCGMIVGGGSKDTITKLVNHCILSEKIKKEIKDENYHQVVHPVGRGKYMYAKFVQVDGYQSIVDEKKFNSERACRQWLKMKKIRGLI